MPLAVVLFVILILLPSAGGSARKHQAVFSDRQADFVCFYMAAEALCDGGVHHVGQDCRL